MSKKRKRQKRIPCGIIEVVNVTKRTFTVIETKDEKSKKKTTTEEK